MAERNDSKSFVLENEKRIAYWRRQLRKGAISYDVSDGVKSGPMVNTGDQSASPSKTNVQVIEEYIYRLEQANKKYLAREGIKRTVKRRRTMLEGG